MTHHHDHSHVHECACSKTGHLRRLQLIFAAIVLGLSAYTLSQFTGWSEVRFVVAAAAFAILSHIGIHRYDGHLWPLSVLLLLDFLNCAMFLAVWIILAEQISCDKTVCAAPGGGHLSIPPCKTIYAALAFAIVTWLLYAISFGIELHYIITRTERVTEKGNAGNV